MRAGLVRGVGGSLVAGVLSLGCSSGSSEPIDASGTKQPAEGDELAAGGAVVAPLILGALEAPASGSTPDAIEITLSSNLDTISVRSKLTDPRGAAVSDCEVTDLFRVGPSAVDWAIGTSRTVPLAYGTALADGVYWHAVSMGIGAYGNHWLQTSVLQPFEVARGVLRPLTEQEFQTAVGDQEEAGVTPDPCPPLPDYTDEMTGDGATSSIDLAPWQGLGTIQPLRWVESATRPLVGPLPSLLTFHALVADRGRLQLDIITPSETPADFDASFPDDGRILLDELQPGDAVASSWATASGSAHVRIDDQGRVRVELTDIVFNRAGRGPAAAPRNVESGLLVGEVVAEEWP